MSRQPLVAGNWKMHKTVAESEAFIQGLLPRLTTADNVDVVICPPFTSLEAMVDSTRGSRVEVYAQNMHEEGSGAFTGEISAAMLSELDVHGVILGHSERRAYFGETDEALSNKVVAALEAGLAPMLCVGETDEEREAGTTEDRLRIQITEGLSRIDDAQLASVAIAYEPVWAIGTGKVATSEQAQEACAFIRSLIAERSEEAAAAVRILYGGSAKPDNAAELLALADCDGLLIGGASLDPESFGDMVAAG
ncbi:MAG: triose-phosphate isomerase [Actinobacteria bacterium]|uniref:triose-phosphate isomerase n=1 Tax=freshwater metagenome TaxID=449393 RepID=A0A6J7CST3_9ZZZZ|nr:triose-phosphate isomerase [Actinomycetota bacterium]